MKLNYQYLGKNITHWLKIKEGNPFGSSPPCAMYATMLHALLVVRNVEIEFYVNFFYNLGI